MSPITIFIQHCTEWNKATNIKSSFRFLCTQKFHQQITDLSSSFLIFVTCSNLPLASCTMFSLLLTLSLVKDLLQYYPENKYVSGGCRGHSWLKSLKCRDTRYLCQNCKMSEAEVAAFLSITYMSRVSS